MLKIAPYHMPKFGGYRKSSYLCTGNRKNSLLCLRAVIIDNRLKTHKAFSSIAGAKIWKFSVSAKFRHVIRSDFQQLTIWNLDKITNSIFYGHISMLCGIENYVLRYKSAYYEVIPDYRETYSVFSIQFFSPLLPFSV